jgi:hypothetical protein
VRVLTDTGNNKDTHHSRATEHREFSGKGKCILRAIVDEDRPPQQYGGYPPASSPQPPYNGGYGQAAPPPQQYGYQQVGSYMRRELD